MTLSQKQDKAYQQDKSLRKRKILMKQKCNYIDHQISLNIQKLDELMNIIKQKRQQQKIGLSTINEVQQNNINQDSLTQTAYSKQKHKQVRKQRRLKFKYSIFRQYDFQSNKLQQQLITKSKHEENNKISVYQQQSQQPTFMTNNKQVIMNEQQLLLQGFNESIDSNRQLQQIKKLMKLQSKLSIVKQSQQQFTEIDINEIQKITIETRYDWISHYLQTKDSDTIVMGRQSNGEQIQVLKFNKKLDQFQCKLLSHQQTKNQQSIINYTYNQFTHNNPQLQISFPKHTKSITVIQPQVKQVIKLDLLKIQKNIRIIVKNQNQNQKYMQRIMIFKQLPSLNQNDQKYKIIWSKYDKISFLQDIILQGGFNYLVTNLCCNPVSKVQLIFNPKVISYVKIQKSKYDPWKSYNILCSSFQQCSKVFMSQNVFDDSKPLEFLRSNFLDYGLVLEIYQNIYTQKVAFLDMKEKLERYQEDIDLLFPEIYTQLQNKNIYLPQQLVIKFFQVTEKPARLYFPQKQVLIGSKIAQHVTIHATFK